ncbi:hypothetical protein BH10BAC2_BH10BAC2_43090 [soil metagenome]
MKKYLFYAVMLMSMNVGCRPAKKVQRIEQSISKKDTVATVIVVPEVDSFSIVRNIVDSLNKKRIDFNTFSAKIKVDYEGKDGGDQATAYVRIQKDSVIWMSLTGALGIEGYRLLISKDSFRLMNKLQKTIQYRSIAYLQEITEVPFDFYSLQDVIIGNPVFIDSNIVSYKNTESELLVLMIGNVFKHLLTMENVDRRITHSKLDDINPIRNRTCDITYESYENAGDFYFSTKRRISVAEKSKLDINIEFKQYNFNKPQDYPFNIPKNYKRG